MNYKESNLTENELYRYIFLKGCQDYYLGFDISNYKGEYLKAWLEGFRSEIMRGIK